MPVKSTRTRALQIPIFIFSFAVFVRLSFINLLDSDQVIYDSLYDQYIYIDLAKSILAGRGLSTSIENH